MATLRYELTAKELAQLLKGESLEIPDHKDLVNKLSITLDHKTTNGDIMTNVFGVQSKRSGDIIKVSFGPANMIVEFLTDWWDSVFNEDFRFRFKPNIANMMRCTFSGVVAPYPEDQDPNGLCEDGLIMDEGDYC